MKTVIKLKNKKQRLFDGIFIPVKMRFEVVYLRLLRKIFKRRILVGKCKFRYWGCWFFVKPHFLLSMKSKNSRMGAGVGNFVRLTSILKPGKPLVLTTCIRYIFLQAAVNRLQIKLQLPFFWSRKFISRLNNWVYFT